MGRKPKFNREIKIDIIKNYLSGENTIVRLANDYAVNRRTILRWINEYQQLGEKAFQSKQRNKSYTKEFKEVAIHEYLNGEGSLESISLKYGITSPSILLNWVKSYNRHEPIKDYDPKGDVYMKATRKTSLEERLEIVKRCITHNNDYKGTAELYDVSYAQVHRWVKKYNELGEEGLIDGRGKKKIESSLTEVEKLERKIKELERKLELKDREEIVIKKLMEVERRRYSLGRNKKRNT